MRSKFFSTAIAALACLILALPAAAQDGHGSRGGILQSVYEALVVCIGSSADAPELLAAPLAQELGSVTWPGGDQIAIDSGQGGEVPKPNSNDTLEVTPVLIPGG